MIPPDSGWHELSEEELVRPPLRPAAPSPSVAPPGDEAPLLLPVLCPRCDRASFPEHGRCPFCDACLCPDSDDRLALRTTGTSLAPIVKVVWILSGLMAVSVIF